MARNFQGVQERTLSLPGLCLTVLVLDTLKVLGHTYKRSVLNQLWPLLWYCRWPLLKYYERQVACHYHSWFALQSTFLDRATELQTPSEMFEAKYTAKQTGLTASAAENKSAHL